MCNWLLEFDNKLLTVFCETEEEARLLGRQIERISSEIFLCKITCLG